jgi:hypothetical protein
MMNLKRRRPGKELLAVRRIQRDANEEHHDGEQEDAGEKLHSYSLPI